jgi:BlaR1 peptidase M56
VRNAEIFLLTYAANALWMTCVVAALSGCIVRLIRRTPSAYLHVVWVAALVLSLLLPLAGMGPEQKTYRPATVTSSAVTPNSTASFLIAGEGRPRWFPTRALFAAYIIFMLVRSVRVAGAFRSIAATYRGPLIQYADVPAPFTAGIRRSVIVLPRSLVARSSERRAAVAHEIAHIRRHDFLLNVIFEIVLIPLAWHPAALFIKSRIDQTRELACDDRAARSPALYAKSLLSLAQVIWTAPPRFAVGMFHSDSLEKRIRNLIDAPQRVRGIRAVALLVAGLASLMTLSAFASTQAIRVAASDDTKAFAGHWIAEFRGHPFFSMQLDANGGGTIANFGFLVSSDGELEDAGPRPGTARITKVSVEGPVLHIFSDERVTTSDGLGQHLKLDLSFMAPNRGQIRVPGSLIKPWTVERR